MADRAPRAPVPEASWGSWEEARRRKLTRGLDVPPAARLAWLEAAIAAAFASGALPRRRDVAPADAPAGGASEAGPPPDTARRR